MPEPEPADGRSVLRSLDAGARLLAIVAGGIVAAATVMYFVLGHGDVEAGGKTVGLVGPPSELQVCQGEMTEACAQKAAQRSGLPVAWMPAPPGFRLAWTLAGSGPGSSDPGGLMGDTGYWSESFEGTDSTSSIELTGLPGGETTVPIAPVGAETVSNGEDTATIQVMDPEFVSMFWTHDGTSYMLSGFGPDVDRDALVAAWRTVRYVQP
jgi:hypothetical protein